jgi:hypothetical protein
MMKKQSDGHFEVVSSFGWSTNWLFGFLVMSGPTRNRTMEDSKFFFKKKAASFVRVV